MKNQKGISIMIGYVMLIAFAVITRIIVFQWVKTYVPADAFKCPDETSLFLKDYSYDCSSNALNLTFINNGLFSIGGYFIYAATSADQELATRDLSLFNPENKIEGIVKFSGNDDNPFEPGDSPETHLFSWSVSEIPEIYFIEIIPIRWQEKNNQKRLVSCGGSKVKELIFCSS